MAQLYCIVFPPLLYCFFQSSPRFFMDSCYPILLLRRHCRICSLLLFQRFQQLLPHSSPLARPISIIRSLPNLFIINCITVFTRYQIPWRSLRQNIWLGNNCSRSFTNSYFCPILQEGIGNFSWKASDRIDQVHIRIMNGSLLHNSLPFHSPLCIPLEPTWSNIDPLHYHPHSISQNLRHSPLLAVLGMIFLYDLDGVAADNVPSRGFVEEGALEFGSVGAH
mmetsp:Transcript_6971/g.11380  ORF Transcript_6971/g.11380 Transcript_6971/m.11380 type:complete len:222 (-) Transcript_6971:228-893(-)